MRAGRAGRWGHGHHSTQMLPHPIPLLSHLSQKKCTLRIIVICYTFENLLQPRPTPIGWGKKVFRTSLPALLHFALNPPPFPSVAVADSQLINPNLTCLVLRVTCLGCPPLPCRHLKFEGILQGKVVKMDFHETHKIDNSAITLLWSKFYARDICNWLICIIYLVKNPSVS